MAGFTNGLAVFGSGARPVNTNTRIDPTTNLPTPNPAGTPGFGAVQGSSPYGAGPINSGGRVTPPTPGSPGLSGGTGMPKFGEPITSSSGAGKGLPTSTTTGGGGKGGMTASPSMISGAGKK